MVIAVRGVAADGVFDGLQRGLLLAGLVELRRRELVQKEAVLRVLREQFLQRALGLRIAAQPEQLHRPHELSVRIRTHFLIPR